jgi:DNA polymerase elongation subunit (family B)
MALKPTKNPQVAKRMVANGFVVNPGKEIPYVVCKRKDPEEKDSVIQDPSQVIEKTRSFRILRK